MSLEMFAGLFFIVTVLVLMGLFAFLDRMKKRGNLRTIPSLENLQKSVNQVVESGKGIHISLGRSGNLDTSFSGTIMALNLLKYLARQSVNGDIPPLATSGDGVTNILSQEALETSYTASTLPQNYNITGSQVTGVTPYSYIAGAMMAHRPQEQSILLITGHYGAEAAILADLAERNRTHTISGTNDLQAQALLFVTTRAPLIAEEFFAAEAYTQGSSLQYASIKTQDVLRVLLSAIILAGAIMKMIGIL